MGFTLDQDPWETCQNSQNILNSDAGALEWGLRMCIPNKFPGVAGAAGPGTPRGEPLVERLILYQVVSSSAFFMNQPCRLLMTCPGLG